MLKQVQQRDGNVQTQTQEQFEVDRKIGATFVYRLSSCTVRNEHAMMMVKARLF